MMEGGDTSLAQPMTSAEVAPTKTQSAKAPASARQPEVFETPDPDDSGPIVVVVEERNNDNIDRNGVTPTKAFSRFHGSSLTSEHDPATRRVSRHKDGNGENVEVIEETPLQRYQRLQSEIRELSEELATAAEKRTPLEQDLPALDAGEVQALQTHLESLIAKEEYQPFLKPNYEIEQASVHQASLSKKLVAHIEALATKANRPKESTVGPDGQITYELYCTPALAEGTKGNDIGQLVQLERRLLQLEKILGANTFMGNMPTNDLLLLIEAMNEKLNLLNRAELEKVDRKLKMMSIELDDIVRSEEKIGIPAHQEKKVNEVYEMMGRADATIQQLPAIIARLQSLAPLHEESMTFAQSLRQLHQQQSKIVQMLSSHNAHLIKVEDGLAENVAIIQKNIDSLGSRMEKISAALSQHPPS